MAKTIQWQWHKPKNGQLKNMQKTRMNPLCGGLLKNQGGNAEKALSVLQL
tara:strand:+ start:1488 stop:1637 length:150 start_codon:yes stop_codon:yes gene_type:complete